MLDMDISFINDQDLEDNYRLRASCAYKDTRIQERKHSISYHCLDEVADVATAYEHLRHHPHLDELTSSDAFAQLLEIAQAEPQRSFRSMANAFYGFLKDTVGEIQTATVLMMSWLTENT
jgi:hypothetical protein